MQKLVCMHRIYDMCTKVFIYSLFPFCPSQEDQNIIPITAGITHKLTQVKSLLLVGMFATI